jgi:hypothetical protein
MSTDAFGFSERDLRLRLCPISNSPSLEFACYATNDFIGESFHIIRQIANDFIDVVVRDNAGNCNQKSDYRRNQCGRN